MVELNPNNGLDAGVVDPAGADVEAVVDGVNEKAGAGVLFPPGVDENKLDPPPPENKLLVVPLAEVAGGLENMPPVAGGFPTLPPNAAVDVPEAGVDPVFDPPNMLPPVPAVTPPPNIDTGFDVAVDAPKGEELLVLPKLPKREVVAGCPEFVAPEAGVPLPLPLALLPLPNVNADML